VLPDREDQDLVTDVPAAFRAPAGTFFDFCAVHLVTTNTLDRLRELAPAHRFEARRFRPNFVVDVPHRPLDDLQLEQATRNDREQEGGDDAEGDEPGPEPRGLRVLERDAHRR
jgi:hypothetical protein